MSRPNPFVFAISLILFVAGLGALYHAKGGLYLIAHEIDTYHLLDVLFRMERGLVPHVDFLTPLGALSFAPFLFFLNSGESVGQAILHGQTLVAACLVPLVWYTGWSRLGPRNAYFFGLATLMLVMALAWGGAESKPAISMFYNRWAWAISFVAILIAILPPHTRELPIVDGAILGLLAMALTLIKITYVVSFGPALLIALVMRRSWKTLITASVVWLILLVAVLLVFGAEYWIGYFDGLLTVSANEVRPFSGVPFTDIVTSPETVFISLTALAAVLVVNRAGDQQIAMALLLLLPGFFYTTYQNFGNDPQWLIVLAVIVASRVNFAGEGSFLGLEYKGALAVVALIAMVLFSGSAIRLSMSPLQHFSRNPELFQPMLPKMAEHQDIFVRSDRANRMTAQTFMDAQPGPWSAYHERAGRPPELEFGGVTFPVCEFFAGTTAWLTEISDDLERRGIPDGSSFFTATILSAFWLFGPYEPVEFGAPWYYGGLTGIENADYILIPKCSFSERVRTIMINDLTAADLSYQLVEDNGLYALFELL